MTNALSWLWLVTGWAAILPGAWLLATGRLRLKRSHVRCCPVCGYSMAGIESRKCPECGTDTKTEREMTHAPVRKRWRLLGALMLAFAWCGVHALSMARYGWAAMLPDWSLAVAAPVEADYATYVAARNAGDAGATGTPFGGGGLAVLPGFGGSVPASTIPKSLPERLSDDMFIDTWRRINQHQMSGASARAYFKRAMRGEIEKAAGVTGPAAWPSDVPIPEFRPYVQGRPDTLPGAVRARFEIDQRARTKLDRVVEVFNATATYEIERTSMPVDASRPRAAFMLPVASPELDRAVIAAVDPSISVDYGEFWVQFGPPKGASPVAAPRFLWIDVRVLIDGELLGAGFCDLSNVYPGYQGPVFGSIAWYEGAHEKAVAHPERVELELVGNPSKTFDAFMENPTGKPEAWGGTLRIKPRLNGAPPAAAPN